MSKIIFNGVDYAGGSGNYFNPVIYSDTERKIGVWRDNKPLYKKTYHFNSTVWINANGWTNGINVDTTGVETLVDAEVLRTLGAYSYYGYLQVVPYDNLLNIFNCRNTNLEIDTITLFYTKISDVAGSGDYNTDGVPTVHYSTSEQVIGTWLGKPLYQNVLTLTQDTNLLADTWVKTEFARVTMQNLIKVVAVIGSSGAVIEALSGGFIDDKLSLNSARNVGLNVADTARLIVQYTKTTD